MCLKIIEPIHVKYWLFSNQQLKTTNSPVSSTAIMYHYHLPSLFSANWHYWLIFCPKIQPFFGLVAMKAKLFCPFSIKSKQGTSKEVIIEVKQNFFKKLSVIYCWNECHIQCWKKRDTHFNTQFNKFGYSNCDMIIEYNSTIESDTYC